MSFLELKGLEAKNHWEAIIHICRTDSFLCLLNGNSPEAQALKDAIQEGHNIRTIGVRQLNRAAGPDYTATAKHIKKEVGKLWTCTGVCGFTILAKGHLHNLGLPEIITSGGSEEFCVKQFEKPARDIAMLFEAWSLMKGSGALFVLCYCLNISTNMYCRDCKANNCCPTCKED